MTNIISMAGRPVGNTPRCCLQWFFPQNVSLLQQSLFHNPGKTPFFQGFQFFQGFPVVEKLPGYCSKAAPSPWKTVSYLGMDANEVLPESVVLVKPSSSWQLLQFFLDLPTKVYVFIACDELKTFPYTINTKHARLYLIITVSGHAKYY